MSAIWTALDGKKMYITALVVAILGLLNAFGIQEPAWVDMILAAFGITATKSAIAKINA